MGTDKHSGKIVVIGAGNVGATVTYSLLLQKLGTEIVLIDTDEDKASGAVADMQHSTSFYTSSRVRPGGYEECDGADIIIVTAGVGRKPGQTRIDLAKTNVEIAKDIAKTIKKYNSDPLVLVVSNPVDIITYVIQRELDLPASRCIGTGTSLDTARLRHACATQLNMDIRDMRVYMCGEHGDSMFPVWSSASVGGAPLKELLEASGANCDEMLERTVNIAADIIRKRGATFYGIGNVTARIAKMILMDENSTFPVSKVQQGEYMGLEGVATSLPYIVGRGGLGKGIPISMDKGEQESFMRSAQKLKDVLKEVLG